MRINENRIRQIIREELRLVEGDEWAWLDRPHQDPEDWESAGVPWAWLKGLDPDDPSTWPMTDDDEPDWRMLRQYIGSDMARKVGLGSHVLHSMQDLWALEHPSHHRGSMSSDGHERRRPYTGMRGISGRRPSRGG